MVGLKCSRINKGESKCRKGSTDREMERGTVAKRKLNKLNSGGDDRVNSS